VGSEECDDGNLWAYDGCSTSCEVECGWDCSGEACLGICGDGMRKGDEECDDGNTDSRDGCSRYCSVESGYTCGGAWAYWWCGGPGDSCLAGCGEGQRVDGSSKECDDGNTDGGDGCSGSCRIECGWECDGGTMDSADGCSTTCGDKMLGGEEECDDGNDVSGDGCSSSCKIEAGFTCVHYGMPSYPCGLYGDSCHPVCGDGLVMGGEVWQEGYCDDGNLESGDGSSGW